MKRVIAIFFMGIYMLSFSELHQFLRIPVLIQHFVEHRHQNPSISFLAFLNLHYIHQYVVDEDYQRDNQLPFRHVDCCAANVNISWECPANTVVQLPTRTTETKNEFIVYDEEDHSLLSIADIFQPPRCA